MVVDVDLLRVSRELLVKALAAEGVPGLGLGYANIHRLPMYQKKIAYGFHGFPWTFKESRNDISYNNIHAPSPPYLIVYLNLSIFFLIVCFSLSSY